MIISTDAEKSIKQNLTLIYDRDSQQRREEINFNIIKAICAKPNIILTSEKLKKCFLLDLEQESMSTLAIFIYST